MPRKLNMTDEERLEHRRALRRAYWERKTPEQRKEMRQKAQKDFWARMSDEERKQKAREYELNKAIKATEKAAAMAMKGE